MALRKRDLTKPKIDPELYQQNLDLLEQVNTFALAHPELGTPAGAQDNCAIMSEEFLLEAGRKLALPIHWLVKVGVMPPYSKYCCGSPAGHYVARVGRIFIDLTARQFHANFSYPRVWVISFDEEDWLILDRDEIYASTKIWIQNQGARPMGSDCKIVCCYCGEVIEGEPEYCIPEDFPNDKRHELKPLCEGCGGSPEPTLDEICAYLDRKQELIDFMADVMRDPNSIENKMTSVQEADATVVRSTLVDIPTLEKYSGGLVNGELVVLMGRPSSRSRDLYPGTVTGRFSCTSPNMDNGPKPEPK